MSWSEHTSGDLDDVKCSLTIVSDSLFQSVELSDKSKTKDESGPIALEVLIDFGIMHTNLDYLPDELSAIKAKIESEITFGTDLIVLIGGTGISKRDVTYEAVKSLIHKEITGFGEEFRRKSIEQIGSFGMMSRALAGTKKESLIVCLPGSPKATELGLKLFLPILGHALQLLKK